MRASNTYRSDRPGVIARVCLEKWGTVFLIRYGIINAKEHFNGDGLFSERSERLSSNKFPVKKKKKEERDVGSRRYEAAAAWRECSINQRVITGITRV